MMDNADRLYEFLPAVYRLRDADQGYPLRALLQVLSEQAEVVEEDIAQLYENWFVETCQDWAVPYIGDLIGYRLVHEAGEPGDIATPQGKLRNKILIPRREVANTIRYRRRKGTLALLELLAKDVAGWPGRAVEFYKLLGWTQALNHLRLERGRTVDTRMGDAVETLDGPFDELAHTVDVRRISSHRTGGRYNISNIGLFVWRLKSYSVTKTSACCLEEVSPRCFTFSVLGNDIPLYNLPQPEVDPTHIAEPLNLPTPISRRRFEERVTVEGQVRTQASADYYGKSLAIWAADWPEKGAQQPVPRYSITPADLSNWQYMAPPNVIAVDPELGRMVFPTSQLPKQGVIVSYHYAFCTDIGGGEYDRPLSQPIEHKIYRVCRASEGCFEKIADALKAWDEEAPKPASAVVEILDSGVYTEQINIALKKGESLQIRAASRVRPVIRLLDYMAGRPDALGITWEPGSRMTLDGLLIAGRGLRVYGPEVKPQEQAPARDWTGDLVIRHCTLVPGWSLNSDCAPSRPAEPSLELMNVRAQIAVSHSIIGSIQVVQDEVGSDPLPIHISDSILDAAHSDPDCDSPACEALSAPGWPLAHSVLTITRSTVLGTIYPHAIELAENSIFMGKVEVGRRQIGCTRFCYVAPGSRTPRRFRCQPDLVEQAIEAELLKTASDAKEVEPDKAEIEAAKRRERDRVRPQLNSTRYGTPCYCQLAESCAAEIKQGADDESEMGVFHDLYEAQRAANLRARLQEYVPAGTEVGIIYAS